MLQTNKEFENQDSNLKNLKAAYSQIKKHCRFQQRFSNLLLCGFFLLQYSVPVFLVVLGSLATSEDQLILLFQGQDNTTQINSSNSSRQILPHAEILASRIIFVIGLVTILLGVINNIIQPAKSYDEAARFSNKFNKFRLDLDLEIIQAGGIPKSTDSKDFIIKFKIINEILFRKNQELYELIDKYNKARSLSNKSPDIDQIIQEINKRNEDKYNRSIENLNIPADTDLLKSPPNSEQNQMLEQNGDSRAIN